MFLKKLHSQLVEVTLIVGDCPLCRMHKKGPLEEKHLGKPLLYTLHWLPITLLLIQYPHVFCMHQLLHQPDLFRKALFFPPSQSFMFLSVFLLYLFCFLIMCLYFCFVLCTFRLENVNCGPSLMYYYNYYYCY